MRIKSIGAVASVLLLASWCGAAFATAEPEIEASMRVTGSIDVDEGGRVTAHAEDQPGKLPAGVVQLLDQVLPTLRFQPTLRDGHPQAVHAGMSLVVVANRIDPQHYGIRIRSARFDASDAPSTRISVDHREEIRYPMDGNGMMAGGGTVYLAVRIDRSGHPVDVETQQVNLRASSTPREMQHWREMFAKPAMAAVRKFTFHVPTTGPSDGGEFFSGVLPVVYLFEGATLPAYGTWDSYVPGPIKKFAWLEEDQPEAGNNEAIPDGSFAASGTTLKLLTPLGDG